MAPCLCHRAASTRRSRSWPSACAWPVTWPAADPAATSRGRGATSTPPIAAQYFIVFVAASPDTQIGDVQSQPCAKSSHARTGRHTSAIDSLSDPFSDADAVPWPNDYCQEMLWLDLASAAQ